MAHWSPMELEERIDTFRSPKFGTVSRGLVCSGDSPEGAASSRPTAVVAALANAPLLFDAVFGSTRPSFLFFF